jgi:hypothetical protein
MYKIHANYSMYCMWQSGGNNRQDVLEAYQYFPAPVHIYSTAVSIGAMRQWEVLFHIQSLKFLVILTVRGSWSFVTGWSYSGPVKARL